MTEAEMRKRMKEINEERDRLRNELKEYERYFSQKDKEAIFVYHEKFLGKCYKPLLHEFIKDSRFIKAFKIIEVLQPPNENYARCLVIKEGCQLSCWSTISIDEEVMCLWGTTRFAKFKEEKEEINFYSQISQEEFEFLYREYLNKIEDMVYE